MKTKKSGAVVQPKRWMLELTKRVADCYKAVQNLPPICHKNCDETGQSVRWSPESCHFQIDVEHGLRDAIKGQPDEPKLRKAWERLLKDDSTIRNTEARLISLVAPTFNDRQLDPRDYFKPVRR